MAKACHRMDVRTTLEAVSWPASMPGDQVARASEQRNEVVLTPRPKAPSQECWWGNGLFVTLFPHRSGADWASTARHGYPSHEPSKSHDFSA